LAKPKIIPLNPDEHSSLEVRSPGLLSQPFTGLCCHNRVQPKMIPNGAVFTMNQIYILTAYIGTGPGGRINLFTEDNPLVIILSLVIIVILGFIFYKALN